MLNRASNVYGTGSEPTTKCTSFSSSTTRHGNQVTSIHTHTTSSTEFSIKSGVAGRETLKPRYSYRKCVLMSGIISLDDSPRRKTKVLQAIKSWPPCIVN